MRRLATAAALVLIAACSSTGNFDYRDAARKTSDELMTQLEARTDTRQVRLVVNRFQTSGHALRTTTKSGRVYYDTTPYDDVLETFRHQLISDLAQRVRVVHGPTPTGETTAVLMGTVNFAKDERVVVQICILDSKTREILATANPVVR